MFNSLTGTVSGKGPQKIFIDTHGIEWDITVSDSALNRFPPVGESAKVYTWLQHTDQLMTLFGFFSESERNLFFDLLKVDGIGPKAAMKILGNIQAADLAKILDSGDLESLQKVPGVGKKTAAKMLLQLKGKLHLEEETAASVQTKQAVPYEAVVAGLVSMGYERRIAEQAVAEVSRRANEDEKFSAYSEKEREDYVFRQSLVELAQ
ncbi:MAG: Holliday junction branch migration protein RuvA [Treponema sp.]|nr:Holliday junction branch migration protein RuvA [Treponema sp.]MBQ1662083.1 Holliday junction branch migration protein RuvA [Treponema sp.]MBR6297331.1 Holliday junction branch migration protein RuvA [Treponema sp.]